MSVAGVRSRGVRVAEFGSNGRDEHRHRQCMQRSHDGTPFSVLFSINRYRRQMNKLLTIGCGNRNIRGSTRYSKHFFITDGKQCFAQSLHTHRFTSAGITTYNIEHCLVWLFRRDRETLSHCIDRELVIAVKKFVNFTKLADDVQDRLNSDESFTALCLAVTIQTPLLD